MSHRTLARIAIFMIIVFGLTVLLYPFLFNSEDDSKTPAAAAPIAPMPVGK